MYGLGIKIHFNWYVIGSGYLLDAFFSTVVVNLENNKWGSRFPLIMNELNQGELNYKHAKDALDELNIIKNELMNISVDKVIWDIEDKTINGPVKYSVNPNTDNLSDYFQTSEDSDFIALLIKTIEQSILFKKNLKICKFGDWIHHPRLLAEKWDNRYNELDKKIQEELDELPFTKKKEYRLKVIKKSKIYPNAGDVFLLNPKKGLYFWGVVINNHLNNFYGDDYVVVFIFKDKVVSLSQDFKENINMENLLINPVMVEKTLWEKGYFYTIDHIEISDLKFNYGFYDDDENKFYDEYFDESNYEPKYYGNSSVKNVDNLSLNIERELIIDKSLADCDETLKLI